jgi:hypothetical protein
MRSAIVRSHYRSCAKPKLALKSGPEQTCQQIRWRQEFVDAPWFDTGSPAAARHDLHVAVVAHVKVVVDQLAQAGLADDDGDVAFLTLGAGLDADVNAGLSVAAGIDSDVLGGLTGLAAGVLADLTGKPVGAFNIRKDSGCEARQSTEHIAIDPRSDGKSGIDIRIKPGTKGEKCYIPVIISKTGLSELVYNDFYVGDDCDVEIVAGCGRRSSIKPWGVNEFLPPSNLLTCLLWPAF